MFVASGEEVGIDEPRRIIRHSFLGSDKGWGEFRMLLGSR